MTPEIQQARYDLFAVTTPPFYLDQCNSRCVWVKDCRGQTVFLESFTDFPDELTANDREGIINTAIAVGKLLVAIST